MIKSILRVLFAGFMIFVGVAHFTDPEPFVRIMPEALPAHLELVYISGAFEILGGIGLLIAQTRQWASWGLIALFIAVFPANINMAVNGVQIDPANPMPDWALWARLPLQLVLIALAWWLGRPPAAAEPE